MVLATQEVRLTGLEDATAPGCFPTFFSGKVTALLKNCCKVPAAGLQLKISSSSLFARGPSAFRKEGAMSSGRVAPMIAFVV